MYFLAVSSHIAFHYFIYLLIALLHFLLSPGFLKHSLVFFCLASGSGSEEEEEEEEDESSSHSEGEEEEGEEESVTGSGRSEHSAGKTVKSYPSTLSQQINRFKSDVSSVSEDISEEEQSEDDFEEERENGNHIPACE